ncbi:MAG: hypothetical protein RMJ28_02085 [Nitrososphaerota archaeon]|nr:hypothetical protein [Candidatus Calditenuaceae archaeon]MDW8073013.1 hypothetical protein [Nitrososphaerota archaeon]
MARPFKVAIVALSVVIVLSTALVIYVNAAAYPSGPSRALCTLTRIGDYLFEAFVFPSTPISGEDFQVTVTVLRNEHNFEPLNLTLILFKPGRFSFVDGPVSVPLGVKTWRIILPEEGLYDALFIVSGPGGSGQVSGRLQVISREEAEFFSAIRFASYVTLWTGVPLLTALVVYVKMGERGDKLRRNKSFKREVKADDS